MGFVVVSSDHGSVTIREDEAAKVAQEPPRAVVTTRELAVVERFLRHPLCRNPPVAGDRLINPYTYTVCTFIF